MTAGTPPVFTTGIGTTTPALITFGTKTNTLGSITTAGVSDVFISQNRNLSFTTGLATSSPSQITVGPNVSITADPPVPAPTVNAAALNMVAASPAIAPAALISSALGSTQTAAAANFASITPMASISANSGSLNLNGLAAAVANNAANSQLALGEAAFASGNGSSMTALIESTDQPAGNGLISRLQTAASTGRTLSGGVSRNHVSQAPVQKLDSGALLLAPDHDSKVETSFGTVDVASGSVVLLIASEKTLAVYDLHDGHKGAVTLSKGEQRTTLSPGRSAILTSSNTQTFEEINPAQTVAYRALDSKSALGAKLYQAEFEMFSMMRGLKGINHMAQSDNAQARKAAASVFKTAAILTQLRQGGEQFTYHAAPQMTAYAPQVSR